MGLHIEALGNLDEYFQAGIFLRTFNAAEIAHIYPNPVRKLFLRHPRLLAQTSHILPQQFFPMCVRSHASIGPLAGHFSRNYSSY